MDSKSSFVQLQNLFLETYKPEELAAMLIRNLKFTEKLKKEIEKLKEIPKE